MKNHIFPVLGQTRFVDDHCRYMQIIISYTVKPVVIFQQYFLRKYIIYIDTIKLEI